MFLQLQSYSYFPKAPILELIQLPKLNTNTVIFLITLGDSETPLRTCCDPLGIATQLEEPWRESSGEYSAQ